MLKCKLYLGILFILIINSCNEYIPLKQLTVSTFAGHGVLDTYFVYPRWIVIDNLDNIYITDGTSIRKIYFNGESTALPEFKPPPYFVEVRFRGLALEPNNNLLSAFETNIGDGPYGMGRFKIGGSEILSYFSKHSMLESIVSDKNGNIYLGTRISGIKKYDPILKELNQFVGGIEFGYADGIGVEAKFGQIHDLSIDNAGNLYAVDNTNHCIRKITPDGKVTTIAGTNEPGFKNGNGVEARFSNPSGLSIDKDGNIYVADTNNHVIRKITPNGVVTTIAGTGNSGYTDGPNQVAQFNLPLDVAINSLGHIYVTDYSNNVIRLIK